MNLKLYPIVQQQGIPAAVMSFRFRITARSDSKDFPAIGQNSVIHDQVKEKIGGFFLLTRDW